MQLTARRCSYVIYLNRFNKDFEPYRILPPPRSGRTADVAPALNTEVLAPALRARIATNQQAASETRDVLNTEVLTPALRARIATKKQAALERRDGNKPPFPTPPRPSSQPPPSPLLTVQENANGIASEEPQDPDYDLRELEAMMSI